MSDEIALLKALNEKLDRILAVLSTKDQETEARVASLRNLGHDWAFIGSVVGLSPDAARMMVSRRQKVNARRRSKKR